VGVAISLITYLPYLIGDARNGWNNVRALVQASGAPAQVGWDALRYALLNVGGRQIHALAGSERYREFLASIVDLDYWPDRIEEALVVLSAMYLIYRCWKARSDGRKLARDGLLLAWLIVPVLFFLRSATPVYPHYLIPLYPAPYLALAIGIGDVVQAIGARVKRAKAYCALLALLLGMLVAWQSYLSLSIHAYVAAHHTPGGMGTPLRILRQVVERMEQYARTWNNRQVVMLCPGDNPRWDECPVVFGHMTGRSLDVRFVDGRASLLFPQSEVDTLIVLAPDIGPAAARELDGYADHLPDADVSLRENVSRYRFYRVPAGTAISPAVPPADSPTLLANGVELLGYALSAPPAPGSRTQLALYWRVAMLPPHPPVQGYSFANHLLATDGSRIAQKDGPGHRAQLWRPGDALVSWFDLELAADAPPPPYRLRVGMYILEPPNQFIPIPTVDANGRPVADAVDWPISSASAVQ
jgi:hypothetical protein